MAVTSRLRGSTLRLLTPLLLAGCATHVNLPPLPECHPASPDAPGAPVARPSGVLEPRDPAPETDSMEGHDHRDHGMAGEATEDEPPDATTPRHEHQAPPPAEGRAPDEPDHGEHHSARGAAEPDDEAPTTVYSCSMHPEVRFDTPGTCPVCGMALEEVEPPAESGEDDEASSTHHEHPQPGGER